MPTMRPSNGPTCILLASIAILLGSQASAASHPFTKSSIVPVLREAVNQKGLTTYGVQSTLVDQFTSIQHCLPINFVVLAAADDSKPYAVLEVNTTSLEGSYAIHSYVQNQQLRLSLNDTVESRDLVNVTITVPATWGNNFNNATVTGKGWLNFNNTKSNVASMQLQLSGTGTATVALNPSILTINADTNGSFFGTGQFNEVVMDWASTQAATVSNSNNVIVQKSGSGNVYIAAVTYNANVIQSGKGVTSIVSTDSANVVQSGPGAVFLGIGSAANISYAGGGNTTYVQGTGLSNSGNPVAQVQYTTTGNGTLLFSSTPGAAYPAINVNGAHLASCLNVTKWSSAACNETAVPVIPYKSAFPAKLPKCAGTWILSDSDMCYKQPLQGFACQTVMPANGGEKTAFILILFITAISLIWVNSL